MPHGRSAGSSANSTPRALSVSYSASDVGRGEEEGADGPLASSVRRLCSVSASKTGYGASRSRATSRRTC
jgi:hypothetical protein